jgi:hypothetical protein
MIKWSITRVASLEGYNLRASEIWHVNRGNTGISQKDVYHLCPMKVEKGLSLCGNIEIKKNNLKENKIGC